MTNLSNGIVYIKAWAAGFVTLFGKQNVLTAERAP